MTQKSKHTHSLLGVKIHIINYDQAVERVMKWASKGESRYVCLANFHMVMEAYDSPKFKQILNQADLVTPDGKPLSWLLRSNQVCGRELTFNVHATAQRLHKLLSEFSFVSLREILIESVQNRPNDLAGC